MTVHKFVSAKPEAIGDREARVICSTGDTDRAGDIVVQDGIDLSAYKANPIVLWGHDTDQPIAKATDIGVVDGRLMATVEFPPIGTSAKADEICALVKAGVVSAVSIGFTPLETEPLDPANPKKGPQRYLKSELGEFSFVSVPANKDALTVARANAAPTAVWKVGASRNLPVLAVKALPREVAAKSILDQAEFEGDHPNTAFARKGFLVYDAADAESDGAYRIPFAEVVDGRLSVTADGLAQAKSLLDRSDLSDDVAAKARAVIEHYEAKMAKSTPNGMVTREIAPLKAKSLYDVAQLAYALSNLGYLQYNAAWEAEMEGDASQVPALLAEACRQVGDALLAMTAEEVGELLAQMVPEGDEAVEKGLCTKDAKPLAKALAIVGVKAGATFSAANRKIIKGVHMALSEQCDALKDMLGDDDEDTSSGAENSDASDTDKSAQALRQKRLRDRDLLALAPA